MNYGANTTRKQSEGGVAFAPSKWRFIPSLGTQELHKFEYHSKQNT